MAVGDLVTADYMYEFNNLALGATTPYDVISTEGLLGHSVRSTTTERFGRNGDVAGRHYAKGKMPVLIGNFLAPDDTTFETRRRAIAAAFAPVVAQSGKLDLVTQFPGVGNTKVKIECRPIDLELPVNRDFALGYAQFKVRFEAPDPILYELSPIATVFSVPTDTETLTNFGNAPAKWTASLVGPAENPILTHNGTGQSLSFTSLTLSSTETLVYDSSDSTAKVNGVSIGNTFGSGFSWFDLDPGAQDITFTATNAGSASFTFTFNSAHWSP